MPLWAFLLPDSRYFMVLALIVWLFNGMKFLMSAHEIPNGYGTHVPRR